MKYIFAVIIVMVSLFSIPSQLNAEEGYIEELLQLPVGPEAYDLELANVNNYYFSDSYVQGIYTQFSKVNSVIKQEIINKYHNNELEYYETQGIITNYKLFVYHANKFFDYLTIKEQTPWMNETDDAILRHYRKMRTHYNRVKYLVSK